MRRVGGLALDRERRQTDGVDRPHHVRMVQVEHWYGPPMLPTHVFNSAADRIAERFDTLRSFAVTRRSFEEWLNWEIFDALRVAGYQVEPKPHYQPLTGEGLFGDLIVRSATSDERVLVEVAICTDFTQSKWSAKINRDAAKLARALAPELRTLQLVVVVAEDLTTPSWTRFLAAIGWDDGAFHMRETPAAGGVAGVHVRGWCDYVAP